MDEERNLNSSEEDKENMDETSRTDTSMSNITNSTLFGAQRVVNNDANVDKFGNLDLSNLSLTNISTNFKEDYLKVLNLNVSKNDIQYFTYMDMFKFCETLDASDNQISKFSASFNQNLIELNLSNNQLKHASQFRRFENLTKLDLSLNNLNEHFQLVLKKLEILDLSSNQLENIPDLSKCEELRDLNLSSNRISSLTDLPSMVCTTTLIRLSISSNQIDDLSQFSQLAPFKEISTLFIADNPCFEEFMTCPKFECRSYIVACCSEKLDTIDGAPIEDTVRTEGEWLAMQGQIRKIGPGNHEQLCAKIASHFPIDDDDEAILPLTPAQKNCRKVLEKRRESSASTTTETERTVNSIYSPCREWNEKLKSREMMYSQKIHQPLFESANTSQSSHNDDNLEKNASKIRKSAIRVCSPTRFKDRPVFRSRSSSSPNEKRSGPPSLLRTNSTDSTSTVILSSARPDTGISISEDSETTPRPFDESPDPRSVSEASSEPSTSKRAPSVADISTIEVGESKGMLEKRLALLEKKVSLLTEQNENLTEVNHQQMEVLESLKSAYDDIRTVIRQMTPKPRNLTASALPKKSDEDEGCTYVLRWEMPIVEGFEIWIDGAQRGKIVGKNNTARIMDLDPNEEHSVQIRAIGSSGIRGNLSDKLQIQRYPQ